MRNDRVFIPDLTKMRRDLAVLMLAFADYEALEIALACHMAYGDPEVPFYVLQNGLGTYDNERTLGVTQRYASLYPGRIVSIVHERSAKSYAAIRRVLDEKLKSFELICKIDDDVFPIAPGWLVRLEAAYRGAAGEGKPATFATPLINNNTDGFPRVVDAMGLRDEYHRDVAMPHLVGETGQLRVAAKGEIVIGSHGTIWAMPSAARWLHEKTTLQPDAYAAATARLPDADLANQERYSIGCMLFGRRLWAELAATGLSNDEVMVQRYCAERNGRIVCVQSVPFIHIAYYAQREENRDILPRIRATYQQRLGLRHPIGLYPDRLLEIEARLRWRPPPKRKAKTRIKRSWLARLRRAIAGRR